MAVHLDEVMSDAQRALRVLERHATVLAAFLFGSQVDGTASADSDIDLAVFVDGAEEWGIRERVRLSCLVQAEAGDHIELHFFPAAALRHAEPASFAAFVQDHGLELPNSAA